jgi:hypothetical protein
MASSLAPTSIDATFPVAGQDNDSQGFRDNFNQIKTDLTYAKAELEDLQTNAVLKTNLTSPAVTASNDLAGLALKDFLYSEDVGLVSALGTITGSNTVTVTNGAAFTMTSSGNLTLAFAGWKNTGHESVKLIITKGGSHSVTLTGVTLPYLHNPDAHTASTDTTGLDYSTRITIPALAGVTIIDVFTVDGGTTKYSSYPQTY